MNAKERTIVKECISKTEEMISLLETVRDAEQERFDDASEAVQEGEKGSILSANSETLTGVVDLLQEAHDQLNEVDIT